MKKIRSRFRNILLENRLLSILLACFVAAAFLLLWECSMEGILREVKIVSDADYWLNADKEMYGENMVIRNQETFNFSYGFAEGISLVTD